MSKTKVDLFRSVIDEQFPKGTIIDDKPAAEILYPDFEPRTLPSGKMRRPDVVLSKDKLWVKSKGGTSLFDREKVFKSKKWISFKIPKDTLIPDSLVVRFTGYKEIFKANHYQIECATDLMRVDSYKGALDNLARNALVKSIELANN